MTLILVKQPAVSSGQTAGCTKQGVCIRIMCKVRLRIRVRTTVGIRIRDMICFQFCLGPKVSVRIRVVIQATE